MTHSPFVQELLHRFQSNVTVLLGPRQIRAVALALSGGVDSIALAWLWHTSKTSFRHATNASYFRHPLQAIIINHKLRPESDYEVLQTCQRFKSITGRDALVHDVDWESHGGPPPRSKLESIARQVRYRALGLTCRNAGIDTLLTGHHADDNAETVLTRLVGGARGVGLHGIAPVAGIPECSNLFGVSETMPVKGLAKGLFMGPLNPGIQVLRPLLPFDKDELIELCRVVGLTWAEDSTNADPTLTQRNAVRRLLRSRDLPHALQKAKLLSLAKRWTIDQERQRVLLRSMHERSSHKSLDLTSGELSLRLPQEFELLGCESDHKIRLLVAFIRDLVLAVSNMTEVKIAAVWALTAEIINSIQASKLKEGNELRLSSTAAKVVASLTVKKVNGKRAFFLRLFRQALHRKLEQKPTFDLVPLKESFVNPDWPYFTKWDGRFWLRLAYHPPVTSQPHEAKVVTEDVYSTAGRRPRLPQLHVRSLLVKDIAALRRRSEDVNIPEKDRQDAWIARNLFSRLRRFGQMIPVLPVIAESSKNHIDDAGSHVVSVPALGYTKEEYRESLELKIAFKHVGDVLKSTTIKPNDDASGSTD